MAFDQNCSITLTRLLMGAPELRRRHGDFATIIKSNQQSEKEGIEHFFRRNALIAPPS
jgi:hypothetical protein